MSLTLSFLLSEESARVTGGHSALARQLKSQPASCGSVPPAKEVAGSLAVQQPAPTCDHHAW